MERALKFTNKSTDGKYTKLVASPLKAQAFEAARNANEFVSGNVNLHPVTVDDVIGRYDFLIR